MGLLDAVMPKASFSMADVIDEVHRLREENESLRAERSVLKEQVVLLSHKRLAPDGTAEMTEESASPSDPPAAAVAAPPDSVLPAGALPSELREPPAAAATSTSADGLAASLQSMRADLATNLCLGAAEAEQAQARSLAEQLQLTRTQLDAAHVALALAEAAREAEVRCVCGELRRAEVELEQLALRASCEQQQLIGRFEELALELEQQASEGGRRALQEQELARRQTAAQISDLEEQLAQMAEEIARRDAVQEQFGADTELTEAPR